MLRGLIALLIMLASNEPYDYVPSADEYVSETVFTEQAQNMRVTCYTSSVQAKTYSGQTVHKGGCASNKANLGKVAYVYNDEWELIGIFECNDIGGNEKLKNGTAIDIWMPTMADANCWIKENGDYAWVILVNAEG